MKKLLSITLSLVMLATIIPSFAISAFAAPETCDHSFTNYVSNGDAGCDRNGTKTAVCDNGCGATDTIEDENTKLEHEWIVSYNSETGMDEKKCVNYDQVADKVCTEGLPESNHPYNNGANDSYTINFPDSNVESFYIHFTSDTKTESGYDYIYIYNSDDTLVGEYCGDALADKSVLVTGSAATIRVTSDSSVNYYGFKVDKILTTREGCKAIETQEHVHHYDEKTFAPTCTKNGYTTYKCSACGYKYVDDVVEKLGHEYAPVVTTAADGTQSTTYKCTRCKYSIDEGHSFGSYVSNKTCTEDGVKTSTCSHCGVTVEIADPATGHKYTSTTTKATATANGKIVKKCSACGDTKTTTIKKIASVKLSATKYIYDGKVKTPSVVVKDSAGKALVKGTDYTVSYPSGRKNVGKYTVKVTFKGKYSGTKSLSFVINPKSTSISKLTALKAGFKITWKKQATQTTGYQIQYSTSQKFDSAKTVTVGNNTTVSKSISKLNKGKKYYVRVRTYKTVGKTKYYSSWSKSKTITTKK